MTTEIVGQPAAVSQPEALSPLQAAQLPLQPGCGGSQGVTPERGGTPAQQRAAEIAQGYFWTPR